MTPTVDTTLAEAALSLATVFSSGGRLFVVAEGRADHARHVAVEFIHPVVAGARSLPAFAINPEDVVRDVGPKDALLVLETSERLFDRTIPPAAQVLVAGSGLNGSELVRWYHVLWELVQIGLEHPGLTGGSASTGGDSTKFLYPFLDAAEVDEPSLLASMSSSADSKQIESDELSAKTIAASSSTINAIASAVQTCSAANGTVFAVGNGGSSCDAARLTRILKQQHIRASSLADDPAILTALANDLGVDQVFARQIEATVYADDVLFFFSTSGSSTNLLTALDLDIATESTIVACAGYGGGPLCRHPNVDYSLMIDSTSVHRVQETQGVLIDKICANVAKFKMEARQ